MPKTEPREEALDAIAQEPPVEIFATGRGPTRGTGRAGPGERRRGAERLDAHGSERRTHRLRRRPAGRERTDRGKLHGGRAAWGAQQGKSTKPACMRIPRSRRPLRRRHFLQSSFLSAPAPESDFGRDRKKQGQHCAQAIIKGSFLEAHPPKQVLAPTGRNSFPGRPTTYRSCFLGWWVVGERSTPSWPPSATGVSPVRRMGDTLVAPRPRSNARRGARSPVRRMGDTLVAPAA